MSRLTVWQPFGEMLALNEAMEQMAQGRLRNRASNGHQSQSMAVDLSENAEGYRLQASLPGVHPDDLSIDFAEDVLTIKAQSRVEQEQEGTRYHLRERAPMAYERSFRFPTGINAEGIEASYEHGVLTLYLPRAESAKPRRINVQTSA
jgi:HSP20 family protein